MKTPLCVSERPTKSVDCTILYAGLLDLNKKEGKSWPPAIVYVLRADAMWPAALSPCNHDFPPQGLYPLILWAK